MGTYKKCLTDSMTGFAEALVRKAMSLCSQGSIKNSTGTTLFLIKIKDFRNNSSLKILKNYLSMTASSHCNRGCKQYKRYVSRFRLIGVV